jgi:hypothetical protein
MPAAPRRYLIVVRRPLPSAPLIVRQRYLNVAPRPLPALPLALCRRYLAVVPRPLPAALLVVCRSVLDRGAQVVAHGAATLPQQDKEKNTSAVVQRNRANITGLIYTEATKPSRRCTISNFEVARVFKRCYASLKHKTSTRASGVLVGDRRVAACLRRWRALPRHAYQ